MKNSNTPQGLTTEIVDRVSLEQALIDVEVANARVIDLTERLTESAAEIQRLSAELERARSVSGVVRMRIARLRSTDGLLRKVARAVLPTGVREQIARFIR